MAITTKRETKTVNSESELVDLMAMVDIIAWDYHGKRGTLWKRPISEVIARGGPPYSVHAVEVPVTSKVRLRELRSIVDRVKNAD